LQFREDNTETMGGILVILLR